MSSFWQVSVVPWVLLARVGTRFWVRYNPTNRQDEIIPSHSHIVEKNIYLIASFKQRFVVAVPSCWLCSESPCSDFPRFALSVARDSRFMEVRHENKPSRMTVRPTAQCNCGHFAICCLVCENGYGAKFLRQRVSVHNGTFLWFQYLALKNYCVAVRLARQHPHRTHDLRSGCQDHPSKNSLQKTICCTSTSNAPDHGRMYTKNVELRIY